MFPCYSFVRCSFFSSQPFEYRNHENPEELKWLAFSQDCFARVNSRFSKEHSQLSVILESSWKGERVEKTFAEKGLGLMASQLSPFPRPQDHPSRRKVFSPHILRQTTTAFTLVSNKVLYTEYRIQYTEYRIQNTETSMQDEVGEKSISILDGRHSLYIYHGFLSPSLPRDHIQSTSQELRSISCVGFHENWSTLLREMVVRISLLMSPQDFNWAVTG